MPGAGMRPPAVAFIPPWTWRAVHRAEAPGGCWAAVERDRSVRPARIAAGRALRKRRAPIRFPGKTGGAEPGECGGSCMGGHTETGRGGGMAIEAMGDRGVFNHFGCPPLTGVARGASSRSQCPPGADPPL